MGISIQFMFSKAYFYGFVFLNEIQEFKNIYEQHSSLVMYKTKILFKFVIVEIE